jgi:hypothetical protein
VSPRSRSAAESDRGPVSRQGRGPEARRALEDVARTLRSIPGPDAWIQALFRLEAIARVAREAGDWELAERMAGQMFEHDPAYGGSHLALALVAEHRGDAATAVEERAAAERLWRDADYRSPRPARLHEPKGPRARARRAYPGATRSAAGAGESRPPRW